MLNPFNVTSMTSKKMLMCQVLCIQETWIHPNQDFSCYDIKNFASHFNSVGRGKGIVTYYDDDQFEFVCDVNTKNFQMTKVSSNDIDVINVYRSQQANHVFAEALQQLISKERETYIIGDFNLCCKKVDAQSRFGLSVGWKQSVRNATHISGSLIDHCYTNGSVSKIFQEAVYFSDHDAIFVKRTDES